MPALAERVGAAELTAWLARFSDLVADRADWLTDLDSAIGDADHGTNLARGADALRGRVAGWAGTTPGEVLRGCGMLLLSTVGGASGSLYGTFFLEMAKAVGSADELDPDGFGAALRAGVDGIVSRGRARPGDKTMVDALGPAIEAFGAAVPSDREHGTTPLAELLRAAADAAASGRDATIPLVARKGRASYLGERSADHLDPGAASAALLIGALADSWAERSR